jgi:predicted molibdopterin-dependent oxidoreductase YjgC
MAHAVLPVLSFMEKSGTFTSADRRIKRLRPLFRLPGPMSDLEILQRVAAGMGRPDLRYNGPEEVMDEIAGLVEAYQGVSYERLGDFGIELPNPGLESDGEGRIAVRLSPAPPIEESAEDAYSFALIPRIIKFHSGSMSRWSPTLMHVHPDEWAAMNGEDMSAANLRSGDTIRITSSRGAIIHTKVRESWHALRGTILLAHNSPSLHFNVISTWEHAPLSVTVAKC